MVEYIEMLFGNNVNNYFWLILLVLWVFVGKIEIDRNNIKIKISLIYILFFFLGLFNIFNPILLILLFLLLTFIFLEFIFVDDLKRKILKNVFYLLLDYIYRIIFEYKGLYFFSSMIIVSVKIKPFLFFDHNIINICILGFAFFILCTGIIKNLNNEFVTLNFDEIYKKMNTIMSFQGFGCNGKLYDFANLLIYKEDKSYFIRDNSYNWISFEFFYYRLKRLYSRCSKNKLVGLKFFGKIYTYVLFIINIISYGWKLLWNILKKLIKIFYKVVICRKNIKYYLRGYSTIEMQLIRTLSVIDGYSSHVFQRKAYEFIYSKIFFASLKSFYEYHKYSNINEYKYYLIYIYIRIAPVRINGKYYSSILKLYNKNKVNDIDIEEFFIWTLGLSHSKIDNSIIYNQVVDIYNMNKKKLNRLIRKFSYNS